MTQITYDWHHDIVPPPGPGDVLMSISRRDGRPTGTCYLIIAARQVRMREPRMAPDGSAVQRMRYEVGRVRPVTLEGVRVEPLFWHRRGR